MRVEILKRIQKVEKKVLKPVVPELVIISYNPIKEKYSIQEHYGKKVKEMFFDHYKEYIFDPEFKGQIILDLMESPSEKDGANVYSFNIKEVRAGVPAGCGVSLEFVEHEDPLTSTFIITVCDFLL